MPPHDFLLKKICDQGRPETLNAARKLLQTAQVRTGPGSGRELGKGASGLPAICAYIASQQLRNNDISKQVAQVSSCLDPKTFAKTLKTVEQVLAEDVEEVAEIEADISYESIVREYRLGISDQLVEWMNEAELALLNADGGNQRYEDVMLLKCSIFYWVCSLLKVSAVIQTDLLKRFKVPARAFDSLVKSLDVICDSVATRIESELKDLQKTSSPRKSKSPTKPAVVASIPPPQTPTRSRARTVALDTQRSQPKPDFTPGSPTKKKSDFPPEATLRSSPRKPKQVLPEAADHQTIPVALPRSPKKKANEQAPMTPVKLSPSKPSRSTNSIRRAKSKGEVESWDMDVEEQEQPKRIRYRPAFLEYHQWHQRDPRVEREWGEARTRMESWGVSA